MKTTRGRTLLFRFAVLGFIACGFTHVNAQKANLRTQDFSSDPGWESFKSRRLSELTELPQVRQDFGYSAGTNHAGGQPGEIGGYVQRALEPSYYAKEIPTKTLNDRLEASGKFSVTLDEGGTGTLFGWFNENSRGWRTPNSLAFRIDGNGGKYWMFYEYGTQNWLTGGDGTFEGERYQTTPTKPYPADGTVHEWKLSYDPDGAEGKGMITFVIDGQVNEMPLAEGHKEDGAVFNRFGMFNQQTTGGGTESWFDDIVLDGEKLDFSSDPGWDSLNNRGTFEIRTVRPYHDFGYSETSNTGSDKGEIGGVIWRDEHPAFYADKVGPLTLEDELYAEGTLSFDHAGSDSGVYLGWFNGDIKRNHDVPEYQQPQKNYLAIVIEGPSRIGHYFRPGYSTVAGNGETLNEGPIIKPDGKDHHWTLRYDPAGAEGNGEITVTFDGNTQTLALKPGMKKEGATFDRFGLFDMQSGGHHVTLYLDDLKYTAE